MAYDPYRSVLVFVEVKLRKANSQVAPLEAIDRMKVERIKRTALHFIKSFKVNCESLRFDVIGIEDDEGEYKVKHVKDAF